MAHKGWIYCKFRAGIKVRYNFFLCVVVNAECLNIVRQSCWFLDGNCVMQVLKKYVYLKIFEIFPHFCLIEFRNILKIKEIKIVDRNSISKLKLLCFCDLNHNFNIFI